MHAHIHSTQHYALPFLSYKSKQCIWNIFRFFLNIYIYISLSFPFAFSLSLFHSPLRKILFLFFLFEVFHFISLVVPSFTFSETLLLEKFLSFLLPLSLHLSRVFSFRFSKTICPFFLFHDWRLKEKTVSCSYLLSQKFCAVSLLRHIVLLNNTFTFFHCQLKRHLQKGGQIYNEWLTRWHNSS